MKKFLSISLILLLSICLVTGCGKKKEKAKDEPKPEIGVNTNEDVIKDQELEVFKFEKTNLIYENGSSKLETKVTNTSDTDATLVQFRIHVMDGDREIANLPGYIGTTMKAGESRILTSTYGTDLTKATSIRYEIIK